MSSAPPPTCDVVVAGGGPAGAALALRAAAGGLSVCLVDPAAGGAWPATYGAWHDELPAWLPEAVVAATMEAPRVFARREHVIERSYAMLSTPRLQAALTAPDDQVVVIAAAAIGVRRGPGRAALLLEGGAEIHAKVIVDCTGPRRVLSGGVPSTRRAEQTAHGLVVPDQPAITQAFMDWRDDHGERGWPSFLYAVPWGEAIDGTPLVLLEETALARRPALPVSVLKRRLHRRLEARGIDVSAASHHEDVRFPVDTPPTGGVGAVVAFGAAAPTMHPATGYSLGTSLALVDTVVEALIAGLPDGDRAAAGVREVLWSPAARVVHHLRRRGLEAVLALDPPGVVDFFDVFFSLPTSAQRVYLSERSDVVALMAVMWQIFRRADNPLRRHLWRWGLPPQGDHLAPAVSPSVR